MKSNIIRLTESQLHNVIKDSVKKVIRESVIDTQFGSNLGGSFEHAIINAWKCADAHNKRIIEDGFPSIFNREAMYGNEEEPFDFREFPTKQDYDKFYNGWKTRHIKK